MIGAAVGFALLGVAISLASLWRGYCAALSAAKDTSTDRQIRVLASRIRIRRESHRIISLVVLMSAFVVDYYQTSHLSVADQAQDIFLFIATFFITLDSLLDQFDRTLMITLDNR